MFYKQTVSAANYHVIYELIIHLLQLNRCLSSNMLFFYQHVDDCKLYVFQNEADAERAVHEQFTAPVNQ
jgi:hypothetical protein